MLFENLLFNTHIEHIEELSYCQEHEEANNYLKHTSVHATEFLKQSLSRRANSANSSFFLTLQPQRAEGRLRQNGNVQSYLLYKHPLLDPAIPVENGTVFSPDSFLGKLFMEALYRMQN